MTDPLRAPLPVPTTILEARAQGRAEALAILLRLDADCGLDDYTSNHPMGDTGDYSAEWNEAALRELFHADDSAWSLLLNAEGEYWNNLGLREEAQRLNALASAPWQEIKRYYPDFNTSTIRESEHGAWVRYSDLMEMHVPALVDRAAVLDEAKAVVLAGRDPSTLMLQNICDGLDKLKGAEPAKIAWSLTGKAARALAAELLRGAESMGDECDDLVLEVRRPGTVQDDDGKTNKGHVLAISLAEYPEEGVYPIDPMDPTAGRVEADPQAVDVPNAGKTCLTCDDHGMIGGPSFHAPDEGGDPCPDCAAPTDAIRRRIDQLLVKASFASAVDRHAAKELLEELAASRANGGSLLEALKEARGALSSINASKWHQITVNDEPVFWQRKEWVEWAHGEVLPKVTSAIEIAAQGGK